MDTKTMGDYRLAEITRQVELLNKRNPLWRDSFDHQFTAAIQRALVDYKEISNLELLTAQRANEINDALTFLTMSIYTSIERVIERKRLN